MSSEGGLIDRLLAGDRRALARLATHVENGSELGQAAIQRIYPRTGRAHVVGVTGAPGTGKSTLIDALISEIRSTDRSVGVVAIDPSSPFSGGATLGDRIRMRERSEDDRVFVRSMASRGRRGGLAPATNGLVHLLDGTGFDLVIVETVGVGQEEIDVVRATHTVVVIQVPGLGDGVQTIKAGLLEAGDVYVVNKADRDGADAVLRDLRSLLGAPRGRTGPSWTPPILKAVASEGSGAREVLSAIDAHYRWLVESGSMVERQNEMARHEIISIVWEQLRRTLFDERVTAGRLEAIVLDVAARRLAPDDAAIHLLHTSRQDVGETCGVETD